MKLIFLMVFSGMISTVMAADSDQQSLQFCEKLQSCAVAELEGQDMSADMKAMVMSSMDGMCDVMAKQFDEYTGYEDLQQQAKSCMKSLTSLSCPALMNGANSTPECLELEKRAQEYE